MDIFVPRRPIRISEVDGRVHLGLDGFGHVAGATLQEAADELVERMLVVAMAFRAGGAGPVASECCTDISLLDFLWQLGEHVASGGEPRDVLFGPGELAA